MNRTCRTIMSAMILIPFIFAASISFSQNLELVGSYPMPLFTASDIEIAGNYAYIVGGAVNGGNLRIIDFSTPSSPTLIGQAIDYGNVARLVVSGNYAYAAGSSYISFYIVDVFNPANPVVIDSFISPGRASAICKAGDNLYFSGQDSGLTIISVADPTNPTLIAEYSFPEYPSVLRVSGNYLYAGNIGGIKIYNISDPLDVTQIAFDTTRTNDMCIYNDALYATINGHGYYSWDSRTTIFDISNPINPQNLGFSTIGGYRIAVFGQYAFMINKTTGGDPNFFQSYLDIIDITNPSQPIHMSHEDLGYKNNYYAIESRHDTLFMADMDYFNPHFSIYRVVDYGIGALAGYVLDRYNNQPISGSIVVAMQPGIADTTDSSGYFCIPNLYNLHYNLQISCPGYYTKIDTGFAVFANDTTSYTILLDRPTRTDVGITAIQSPPSWPKVDTMYSLKSLIYNFGTAPAYSIQTVFKVYYKNALSPFIVDTGFTDSLASHTGRTIVYDDSLTIQAETSITIISYTYLPGDENRLNDTCFYIDGTYPAVDVWYGHPNDKPIVGQINGVTFVDVYIRTQPHAYIGYLLLNLGTYDLHIDSLVSRQYGSLYYPFTDWDDASFLIPVHSPPNPPGWSSQGFLGFSDLGGGPNPYLHFEIPTKILTMAVHIINDSALVGDTIDAFGVGRHPQYGGSVAGDTIGGPGYQIREHFSRVIFMPPCNYVQGDINGDGHSIGGDVTYAVRYFKSQGPPPVDSCYMDSTGSWLYPAGDVNGNCEFRGSDVSRMVAYFKSTATLNYCHFFPPGQTAR